MISLTDKLLLAAQLRRARDTSDYSESQEAMLTMHAACVNHVADVLALHDPAFDAKQFLTDCGVRS